MKTQRGMIGLCQRAGVGVAVVCSLSATLGVELDASLRSKWPAFSRAESRLAMAHGNDILVATTAGLQVMRRSSNVLWTVGGCDVSGQPRDLAAEGGSVFLATGEGELHVIDINDPGRPRRIGGYRAPGEVRGVAVVNGHAYLAEGTNGLQVMDVRKPANPTPVGRYDTPGEATKVFVAGGYAYVADGPGGLHIFDIASPNLPRRVGGVDTGGPAGDVVVSSGFASVAAGAAGVDIIDVRDPTNPQLVGRATEWSPVESIAVYGGYAYVRMSDLSAKALDIRDPANPKWLSTWDSREVLDIKVAGRSALFVFSTGVLMSELTYPWAPTSGAQASGSPAPVTTTIVLSGDYAYTSGQGEGLQILDVRAPTRPRRVGGGLYEAAWTGVFNSSDYAYLAGYVGNEGSSLWVVDIRNPAIPRKVGGCRVSEFASGVVVSGEFAYVASAGSFVAQSLTAVDVSNPRNPVPVGGIFDGRSAQDLALSGTHVYLSSLRIGSGATTKEASLDVIDLGDPANPTRIGRCLLDGYPMGVAVAGDHVFVADRLKGLHVVDVSDPTQPRRVGGYDPQRTASRYSVAIAGARLYLSERERAIEVLDIRDPTKPRLVDRLTIPGEVFEIAVSGPRAFVAAGRAGLQVVDLRNPATDGLPVSISGGKGQSLRIQRSADLVNWEDWQQVTPETDFVELTDRDFSFAPRRFYRAVSP